MPYCCQRSFIRRALASVTVTLLLPIPCQAQVAINEVMWMGSDLSTADEWLELTTTGTGSVDLSGWSLTTLTSSGKEETMVTFSSGTTLPHGAFFLVSNYDEPHSRLGITPDIVTTAVSLPNTKLLLRLRDRTGQIVDEVDDGIGVPFAGSNGSGDNQKASMERIDPLLPGTVQSNWQTAHTTIGFDADSTLLGTPGFPNGTGADPFRASLAPPTSSGATASGALKINEVLSNPAGDDHQEWIELANLGTSAVTLTPYKLVVGSKTFALSSLSGSTLDPGGILALTTAQTGLTLKNSGDTVFLKNGGIVADSIAYPSLSESMSYGRSFSGALVPFCVPTKGLPNALLPWQPELTVQSGQLQSTDKVTVNVQVTVPTGSSAPQSCQVDFGDGTVSETCNPPSHSIKKQGKYVIHLSAVNACGQRAEATLPAEVLRGGSKPKLVLSDSKVLSCIPYQGSDLLINEVMPTSGSGSDEWVELRNRSPERIDLCGLFLDDEEGGSRPYDLTGFSMVPDSYLVFPKKRTKLTLNDTGDQVRLLRSHIVVTQTGSFLDSLNTEVMQQISFDRSKKYNSFSLREDGLYLWSPFPSPGEGNRFVSGDPDFGSLDFVFTVVANTSKDGDSGEYIDLRNVSDRSVVLTNWSLKVSTRAKEYRFPYEFLRPGEHIRISREDSMLELPNAGTLQLFDPQKRLVSGFTWNHAKADTPIVSQNQGLTWQSAFVRQVRPGGFLQVDVFDPSLRKPVLTPMTVRIAGVKFDDEFYEVYLEKYLKEDDIVELLYSSSLGSLYSSKMTSSPVPVYIRLSDGSFLQEKLVRHGEALADLQSQGIFHALLPMFETMAEENRTGMWANEQSKEILDKSRAVDRLVAQIGEDGFHLRPNEKAGLVEMGSVLRFQANVPSHIMVSLNSQPFSEAFTGIVLRGDARVRAYAMLDTPDGMNRSNEVIGQYVVRKPDYQDTLVLNEVYPAPEKGQSEWVELRNLSPEPMSLAGWRLTDKENASPGTGKLPQQLIIGANGYGVLSGHQLKFSLKNAGDTLYLIDPNGKEVDHFSYAKVLKGVTLSNVQKNRSKSHSWCQTQMPTPGSSNLCWQFSDLLQVPETKATHQVIDAYLLKHLKPKWQLYKRKGLVLRTKAYPADQISFVLSDGSKIPALQQKSGKWEGVVKKSLPAGEYPFGMNVTQFGRTASLKNVGTISLGNRYVYSGGSSKRVKGKKGKVKYVNVVEGASSHGERSRVLDRLLVGATRGYQRGISMTLLVCALLGFGLLVVISWGLRRWWTIK